LPAAWYLARNFAGVRLAELGAAAGDVAYSAVSVAISRFEKQLEVDRDLQRRIKAVRAILEL
jgi:chromosomal replication initiation ATPase DnaA